MARVDRRRFLQESLLVSAATALGAARLSRGEDAAPAGPNDRLNVAVLGAGGRGTDHARAFASRPDCRVTCLCDADSQRVGTVAESLSKLQGVPVRAVQDMRRVFDDPEVDIVSVATCNHWHALAAIWAMQAGKDVYVEKPVSHHLTEGRRMVQAAAKLGRICQGGTQYRSCESNWKARDYIASGKLGQVRLARCLTYRRRASIGKAGIYSVPSSVDYNLFCGPAPMAPVTRPKFHYDWHWFWDFGNGELGNNSVHRVDVMRLVLSLDGRGLGRGVLSYGGRVGFTDAGETPTVQVTLHDFDDLTVVQEVRNLETPEPPHGGSILYTGTEGYMVGNLSGNVVYDPQGKLVQTLEGPAQDHFANFVAAVRSRKTEDLKAPIVEGHLSTALIHVANISQRMGSPAAPKAIAQSLEKLATHENAMETFEQIREHLRANHVDIAANPLTLGPWLALDPHGETFPDNPVATAMLTRADRAPFLVPKEEEL